MAEKGRSANAKWPFPWGSKLKLLGSDQRAGGEGSVGVAFGDLGDRNGLVISCVAGLAELRHALGNHLLHGLAGGLHVVARIELLGLGPEHLANRSGHGQAVVGVDVDLAYAVANAELDLFDRNTP